MSIIGFLKKRKSNFIESIDVNKMPKKKLDEIANIAFNSEDLINEDRNNIMADGRTLEQTIKDSYKNAIKSEQESSNPKFHRTPKEQQLSFDFFEQHATNLKKMEEIIYDYDEEVVKLKKSKNYASKFSKEHIVEICNKEIDAYNTLKRFCYDKGKSGELYFQNMWEYCHYDWNDCFEFIELTRKYLYSLTESD